MSNNDDDILVQFSVLDLTFLSSWSV